MSLLGVYRRQKWIAMATLTTGTLMQWSTCREETALFGLRWAFSSVTLPINEFLRNVIFTIGDLFQITV
jgi:hypothetical protein